MAPGYISLTEQARTFITPALAAGGYAIDATLGNGHDALFLARGVAPDGKVFGFDIQAAAIANTRRRLQSAGLDDLFFPCHEGHENMAERLLEAYGQRFHAIMFNLGYLPGGDKGTTTHGKSTLAALRACEELLRPGGRLTILAYVGHPGGTSEAELVAQWALGLDPALWHHHCLCPESAHNPPRLHCCERTVE